MENDSKVIVPPHLNAEVYRTDTTGTSTLAYLDHIHATSDGSILIGCSELTGRYWNGGASIFKNISEAKETLSSTKKSINLNTGTTDGCFIENSMKVLLCEDSGSVSIWSHKIDDAWKQWNEDVSVAEHDDAVIAVDCLHSGKEYVTVGADGNVKVWDIAEMICTRNYSAAHSMAIYGVSVRPHTTTSFATGSLDQYVSLWDDNVSKPVLDLAKNNCGVRCLQWVDENRLIFGDEEGMLRIVDVRKPDLVTNVADFPAPVHRLAVNSKCEMVAACCDNKIVSVCDVNKMTIVYHDRHLHSNYVRGLIWDETEEQSLHTVGWDSEIKTHRVELSK